MSAQEFVLDCSVAAAWFVEDEADQYCDRVLHLLSNARAWVPHMFSAELANIVLVAERQGRVSRSKCEEFLRCLSDMPITVDAPNDFGAIRSLLEIAREFRLSAYDATYLELAVRKEIPLATKDKKLREAARSCKLEL